MKWVKAAPVSTVSPGFPFSSSLPSFCFYCRFFVLVFENQDPQLPNLYNLGHNVSMSASICYSRGRKQHGLRTVHTRSWRPVFNLTQNNKRRFTIVFPHLHQACTSWDCYSCCNCVYLFSLYRTTHQRKSLRYKSDGLRLSVREYTQASNAFHCFWNVRWLRT